MFQFRMNYLERAKGWPCGIYYGRQPRSNKGQLTKLKKNAKGVFYPEHFDMIGGKWGVLSCLVKVVGGGSSGGVGTIFGGDCTPSACHVYSRLHQKKARILKGEYLLINADYELIWAHMWNLLNANSKDETN